MALSYVVFHVDEILTWYIRAKATSEYDKIRVKKLVHWIPGGSLPRGRILPRITEVELVEFVLQFIYILHYDILEVG